MDSFRLDGRRALVTGGSKGIGAGLARGLANAGADIVLVARGRQELERRQDELRDTGREIGISTFDLSNSKEIEEFYKQVVEEQGPIDILVNNGLAATSGDLTNATFDEFARHQNNNAGYFVLARHLRDHLVSRSAPGSVINIGSMYGQVASYPDTYKGICAASPVAYHALKGGTIHMTRHLAAYWADDNVRVNCLSPGPFPNPDGAPAAMVERLSERSPMKRMGLPWELKGSIVFLASDASTYVTGQNLTVDGGWTAW